MKTLLPKVIQFCTVRMLLTCTAIFNNIATMAGLNATGHQHSWMGKRYLDSTGLVVADENLYKITRNNFGLVCWF